ncbi:hypothetical protein [Actinoplanes sp. NPDC051851]|uniref:diaminopimelate decarboxylase family protein n=1 Tax=Actinoplanes sp. NPDC051851 TaxID=3154753 RepID=UPI0034240562
MTLSELLPSLRTVAQPHLDPAVWPATARWEGHGDLVVGEVRVAGLIRRHGDPVHVLDEADVRRRCAEYGRAFGAGAVAYSAKAGLTPETGRWIADAGLGCYVSCAAQLRVALLAGFAPRRLVLHGGAKSIADLDAAYACGATVVAGSPAEVERIAARAPRGQRVLLRVVPSVGGRSWVRYGFRLGSRPALLAIEELLAADGAVLAGLDCSLGHQISRFHQFEAALREAMGFAAVVRARTGAVLSALNLGGGHAVAYHDGDDEFAVTAFASRVRAMLRLSAERYALDEPSLTVSPGRALVARAGVTLARVAAVSTGPDGGHRALLEGVVGCPVAAPCAGRHAVQLIGRASRAGTRETTVLAAHGRGAAPVGVASLPTDLVAGDVVAVAGTGAYHHDAAASVAGPAVLSVARGRVRVLRDRVPVEALLPGAA